MKFEHYIEKGGKRLRCGYTTGSCAALAAKAATLKLLTGEEAPRQSIVTPAGIEVTADILHGGTSSGLARCGVRKDAGDDWDVTDGLVIYATVRPKQQQGVVIDGGEGVGRVTLPGLEQPMGAAAINKGPRQMIAQAVEEVCRQQGYQGGLVVEVSAPGGEEIATKTFNPRLGIQGGISILGSSGIVEPQSVQALIHTIEVEMKMLAAQGHRELLITPGNYGTSFLGEHPPGRELPQLKCSNFIGDTLDFALSLGYRRLYLVGHLGKFVKLAGGIMNTHSAYADGRMEIITAHAALAGGGTSLAKQLMEASTTDQCVELLESAHLRQPVMDSILQRGVFYLNHRTQGQITCELLLFTNQWGPLAWTAGAAELFGLEVR